MTLLGKEDIVRLKSCTDATTGQEIFSKTACTFSFPNSAPIMTTLPADAGKAGDIRDSVIQLCGSGHTSHRLLEINSIPSYIGYGIMEEFAEQHDNEWLSRALKKASVRYAPRCRGKRKPPRPMVWL